jgi:hypothetical protein
MNTDEVEIDINDRMADSNNLLMFKQAPWYAPFKDKGNIANTISFAIFVVGIVIVAIWPDSMYSHIQATIGVGVVAITAMISIVATCNYLPRLFD